MAKKRYGKKKKIKRKGVAKKNKPKRMPEHLNLTAYVPGIAT